MNNKRLKPVALAVAMALNTLCLGANAQSADSAPKAEAGTTPAQLDQVIVTGIRASRQNSLVKKRDADSVMDVVTAEDIGKLPDKNVADAVQRVPGVNISSGSGGQGGFSENDRVSIRGTNPSLTQTTVNGHTISTGDWYIGDQSGTVGRSVSFTLLPSEIVSTVEVQKSSQADYIEGGTAGNVNIVTRSPLDFKKQLTLEATVQGLYADLPGQWDPQMNALVNWKNDTQTMGVLFQVFSESRHERRDGQEVFLLGKGTIGDPSDNSSAVVAAHPDLNGVSYPTQIGSAAFTQTSKREGGLIDVQLRPSQSLTLDLNGFYSRFKGTNLDTNFMASPSNLLGQGISPTRYTVVNSTLVAADFPATSYNANDPQPGGTQAFPGLRDSIYRPNAGSSSAYLDLDAKYKPNDTLTLTSKVGYTRGIGETPHDYGYEAYLINSPMSYQLHGTKGPGDVAFPGVDTTQFNNAANVTNGGSWSGSTQVKDEESYGQVDALLMVDDGIWESVKFGLRYADHKRSAYSVNYNCSADPSAPCMNNPGQALPMPAWSGTVSPANFGSGLNAGPNFLSRFWTLNPNDIAAWQSTYNNVNTGPNYQSNFTIREKDTAAYAMVNLSGAKWRGNVGLRVVNTHQEGSAYSVEVNSGDITPINATHNYVNVLPSANFKFDISKEWVARIAGSETMSRADFSSLSPAVTLNNINLTGSGGNADLKPIRSINYEGTLEWYYAPQSLLSFGVFTMDMPSYVAFQYAPKPYLNTATQQIDTFIVTSPYNVAAKNKGFELAWQQPFWKNFGVLANYSYASGHTADGADLVGLSKSTYNAELYYENEGFSTRVAYTYRSSFLVGLANVTPQYAAGVGTLAASINYKVNDHLTVALDGLNLNNPVIKYYSNAEQPQAFYTSGRQFFLGVRLSM
ncbi:TonB-dependent receptor [Roseateles koreensis]|uniref:TonB-dependent receptor n=1 Tax=Roseateles koreensis TaxID=2987526 RepID=A0ABT5KMV0_9BURK|nr:TonB-dependent receptor [Roseateles koreensis]MDC8784234.1 TonB-dependent receptor [Roseateles koreensis]